MGLIIAGMGVFGFVFWGCIQEPLLNFHGQLCLPWELLGWSSPQCWLYPYPFWDILPLAIGHPGFAGWEQEYFIPTDYGMVVVTAAFEEHPNVAREVWTPHPWGKVSLPMAASGNWRSFQTILEFCDSLPAALWCRRKGKVGIPAVALHGLLC